ncbi:unnamed protein product [Rotaria sp. Silwood2]|nr:unnamed protein product [Rotaria sp. Silwood2]CAF2501604.1 unnamed protein product [Rotaria sp. Silwood2]CAF2732194.1 unnamed protein product [Rotaria sp. Silwood2]CAF2899196.1 unnamed protein product [Rotaria sp. Silwood2]CAF4065636.1 unnamed protein product [Rotaria sp. Silwood2]
MSSRGPMRLSKHSSHPQQQQQQSQPPPQFYQPTAPNPQSQAPTSYGGDFTVPQAQVPMSYAADYNMSQPQAPLSYAADYNMSQPQAPLSYAADYNMPQPQAPSSYAADYNMPQPQAMPSNNAFFSPQTAFYAPPSQQQMFSNQGMPGMEYISNNPLFNVGLNVVEQGMKDITGKTVNMLPNEMKKSLSSIKYYFAVDQTYVLKKLCLLLFPFRPRKWSLEYSADEPVPPRVDSNAPDYYIPLMSAITYVLVAGLVLGIQERFTPEQLGMHASSALVWNIIEICVLCFTFYIFNVQSKLRTLDLIAYCGYKYVGMIVALSSYLITHSLFVYHCSLLYVSLSLAYFLVKCLRLQILSDTSGSQQYGSSGNKRRIYLLLLIVILQPLFIWYLTQHLIIH